MKITIKRKANTISMWCEGDIIDDNFVDIFTNKKVIVKTDSSYCSISFMDFPAFDIWFARVSGGEDTYMTINKAKEAFTITARIAKEVIRRQKILRKQQSIEKAVKVRLK